jgi:hypothetical protein
MILDGYVPPLAVAGFAQALAEPLMLCDRSDEANHRQCPLLSLRCERPRGDRAAKRSDEFAPSKANGHLPLLSD